MLINTEKVGITNGTLIIGSTGSGKFYIAL